MGTEAKKFYSPDALPVTQLKHYR